MPSPGGHNRHAASQQAACMQSACGMSRQKARSEPTRVGPVMRPSPARWTMHTCGSTPYAARLRPDNMQLDSWSVSACGTVTRCGCHRGRSGSQLQAVLHWPHAGPVWALSWAPRGHLLAAASAQVPGCTIWDVALQTSQLVTAGASPCCGSRCKDRRRAMRTCLHVMDTQQHTHAPTCASV